MSATGRNEFTISKFYHIFNVVNKTCMLTTRKSREVIMPSTACLPKLNTTFLSLTDVFNFKFVCCFIVAFTKTYLTITALNSCSFLVLGILSSRSTSYTAIPSSSLVVFWQLSPGSCHMAYLLCSSGIIRDFCYKGMSPRTGKRKKGKVKCVLAILNYKEVKN